MKNILFVFVICLASCSQKEKIVLSDGYKTVRMYGDARSIVRPNNSILVMPNVVNAIEKEGYIIGYREVAVPKAELPFGIEDQSYGYFIYFKSGNRLNVGLSKAELMSYFEKYKLDIDLDF